MARIQFRKFEYDRILLKLSDDIHGFIREKAKNMEVCCYEYKDSRLHIVIGTTWDGSFHNPGLIIKAEAEILRKGFWKRLRKKLKEAEEFFRKRMEGEESINWDALNKIKRMRGHAEAIRRWELSRKNNNLFS